MEWRIWRVVSFYLSGAVQRGRIIHTMGTVGLRILRPTLPEGACIEAGSEEGALGVRFL